MAKQRVPQAPEDDLATEGEDYFPPDLDFYNKRTELLGEGDSGSIRVYREGPGGYRDLTFVRGFSLTEFEPEMLQAPPFNGGRFRIHMVGAGKGGMRANFLFKVEPLPGAVAAAAAAAAASAAPATDAAALLAAIKESMSAGFAAIAQSLHQPKPAMGVKETIELIHALNGMQPARAAPERDNLGQFEQLSKLIGVIEDVRGPVDAEGKFSPLAMIARVLDKLAEPLGDVIAGVAERKLKTNPTTAALLTETAGANGASAGTDFSNVDVTPMLDMLKQYLPILLMHAVADHDPATYADMILDSVPAETLLLWKDRASWFEDLALLEPGIKDQREWFTELRALVFEGLTAEPDKRINDADKQPASGDAATGGTKPVQ